MGGAARKPIPSFPSPPMPADRPLTFLCLASYEKGAEFLRECGRQGVRVLFATTEALRGAAWPWESIAETFTLPEHRDDLLLGVSHLARTEKIDRIIPLDEFDLEAASALREHLRVPGMGQTTVRYFRDKLAMRFKAREAGLRVPDFAPAVNDGDLGAFLDRRPGPWILKPRGEASSFGIQKLDTADAVWRALDDLGDRRSFFLVEQYVAGDVYHVDAVVAGGEVRFAEAHGYVSPPFDVMHGGGAFATRTLDRTSDEAAALRDLNRDLIGALGLVRGAVHSEFIRGRDDGAFYFLETAARVGGAHIADVVEAATGVSPWREWARVEVADARGEPYAPPERRDDYAGVVISLARQERPDLSAYDDPEVALRLDKRHHAGLVVRAPSAARVEALLTDYLRRFAADFTATLPAPDRTPT